MNHNAIIKVIEQNVDGCGTDVEMFVQANGELNETMVNALTEELAAAKREFRDEAYTSEDFVNAAIEKFNARFAPTELKTIPAPYELEINF